MNADKRRYLGGFSALAVAVDQFLLAVQHTDLDDREPVDCTPKLRHNDGGQSKASDVATPVCVDLRFNSLL